MHVIQSTISTLTAASILSVVFYRRYYRFICVLGIKAHIVVSIEIKTKK